MKKIETLNDAFMVKLQALYDIETQLAEALPEMTNNANDEELVQSFVQHAEQTNEHIERLKSAFESLGVKPVAIEVEAIRGLIADAQWVADQEASDEVADAMLIGAAMHVEHYEIAGYTSAANWANMLGYAEVEDLLSLTLTEEEEVADKLTALAEEKIDEKAMMAEK